MVEGCRRKWELLPWIYLESSCCSKPPLSLNYRWGWLGGGGPWSVTPPYPPLGVQPVGGGRGHPILQLAGWLGSSWQFNYRHIRVTRLISDQSRWGPASGVIAEHADPAGLGSVPTGRGRVSTACPRFRDSVPGFHSTPPSVGVTERPRENRPSPLPPPPHPPAPTCRCSAKLHHPSAVSPATRRVL